MMKKALVTGGRGFLGHHLVDDLVRRGIEVVVYDKEMDSTWETATRTKPPGAGRIVAAGDERVLHYYGDILDEYTLGLAMEEGCDVVFHNAAIADIEEAAKDPFQTMKVNVLGTVRCLEKAVECGVNRFVYASSVYTMGKRGSFYRISKQTGESLCKTFQEEHGLPYTIVKYGSLYGHEANHWNFIYRVCKQLFETGKFQYESSPDAMREFIHVTDAARETARIADDKDFANSSVLITGHTRMRMGEFFDMVEEMIGIPVEITYAEPEKRRHYVYTPYCFDSDTPVRINMPAYIDIAEGIRDCIRRARPDGDRDRENRR